MCTTYLMHGSRVFLLGNILILILTAKPCKNKNVDAKIPIGHSSDLVGLVGPGHWSRAGRSRTANLENQYRPQNCSASSSYSALNCEIRAIHVITRIDHQLASLCPFQENWLLVVNSNHSPMFYGKAISGVNFSISKMRWWHIWDIAMPPTFRDFSRWIV